MLKPMNLIRVASEFATEDDCLAYLEKVRWPKGVRCVKCSSANVSSVKVSGKPGHSRRLYVCLERKCLHQFTATTGTIFHDTHLPLRKWLLAIALIVDAKKGISANQLKRHLAVQYRTAWHLYHRIRKAMAEPRGLLQGTVEVDETFIGGKFDPRRKRPRWKKSAVLGLIERKGKIQATMIPSRSRQVLVGTVKDRVIPTSRVITDELPAYRSLGRSYRHDVIKHSKEYVRGDIYTNNIENFWSLLKRGVVGSFHKVSIKHLPRYLSEFTYRFNNRENPALFIQTMQNLLTRKALPYQKLIVR